MIGILTEQMDFYWCRTVLVQVGGIFTGHIKRGGGEVCVVIAQTSPNDRVPD